MKKNTSSLRDGLWKQNVTLEEDVFTLALGEHCIRWNRVERIVLQEFSSFNHLKVIEIGAGAVANAALRGLNNGLFQSDGDFSNFFKYRISIPSDKSVPNQLKGL
jgi:hypothetical protein